MFEVRREVRRQVRRVLGVLGEIHNHEAGVRPKANFTLKSFITVLLGFTYFLAASFDSTQAITQ